MSGADKENEPENGRVECDWMCSFGFVVLLPVVVTHLLVIILAARLLAF